MRLDDVAIARFEERIRRVERSNRRMRVIVIGSLSVMVCQFLMGAASAPARPDGAARTIEAERIVIRDEAGKERVAIRDFGIVFHTKEGQRSMWILNTVHQRGIEIFNESGDTCASLFADQRPEDVSIPDPALWKTSLVGSLSLSGRGQEMSAYSTSLEFREAFIPKRSAASDEESKKAIETWLSPRKCWLEISAGPTGSGIELYDARGCRSIDLDTTLASGPRLALLRPEKFEPYGGFSAKDARLVLEAGEDESSVELRDQQGKTRAVLGSVGLTSPQLGGTEKRPVSSLVLFDKDENVVHRLP